MKKKNLFTNLKDYNNELEKILETKDFSEKVKNLLLSMLYKIETSYSDYQKIKKVVPEKWEFIESIIKCIELNCKEIKILKPSTAEEVRKSKPIIEKNKIEVYQNEIKMLEAICELSQNEVLISKKYYIAVEPLKYFFKTSDIVNKTEVIRDFDGWTWFRRKEEIENIQYNLIYQNLLILLGNKTIEKILNNKEKNIDNIVIIFNKLKQDYSEELAKKIIHEIILIITQIYYKENNSKIIKEGKKIQNELAQIMDKRQFLDNLSTEKKQNLKKIDKIEQILLSRRALEKEFVKRNKNGEEIFSLNALVNILKNEKEEAINEINKMSEMMNPKKISEREKKLSEKIQFLEEIESTNIEKNIINLEKLFIQCLNLKLKKCTTKKEIIDLIYITRYYNFLEFNNEKTISQVQELNITLNSYISKLVIKSFELKAINKISEYIEINLKIFKELFNLKIIDLENIECYIEKQDKKYIIKLFDDESLEYKEEIDEIKIEKPRLEKRIKLFSKLS